MQEEKAPQQAAEEAASDTIPTGEASPPAADDHAKQLEEVRAALLYARAEAENIRRRAAEDVQKASRFAVEKFAGSLLSVKDSLEAALATDAANSQAPREGLEPTLKQLEAAFQGPQVPADHPGGDACDHNRPQAMSYVATDPTGQPPGVKPLENGWLAT